MNQGDGITKSDNVSDPVWHQLARLGLIVVFFILWWAIYGMLNERGVEPSRMQVFSRPCDFFPNIIQPWTSVIYLFGGLLLPAAPFFSYRGWRQLGFVLTCYSLASIPAFFCYWLWPVGIIRPKISGHSFGQEVLRAIYSWDQPANCFPSSHVFFAVLGAILLTRQSSGSLTKNIAVWTFAVAICITTITTGQHYFLDIAGGLMVALCGYYVASWIILDYKPIR